MTASSSVAVMIPCLNEENAIGAVVRDFRQYLPAADIYVFDNGSTDETIKVAKENGAIVRCESKMGKGNVVRRMFADVNADIYVLVDGDGTYDAASAPEMVSLLINQNLDMVTGKRVPNVDSTEAFRQGHAFGNCLFSRTVRTIFHTNCEDVLSGYRVLSRRFVKSFPSVARGFEIEVEMTAHASLLRVPTIDLPTLYSDRAPGSVSKLNTFQDGFRIALALFRLYRSFAPSRFFGTLSLLAMLAASAVMLFGDEAINAAPSVDISNVIAIMLFILGLLLLSVGVILNAVSRNRVEVLRLAYLASNAPNSKEL